MLAGTILRTGNVKNVEPKHRKKFPHREKTVIVSKIKLNSQIYSRPGSVGVDVSAVAYIWLACSQPVS